MEIQDLDQSSPNVFFSCLQVINKAKADCYFSYPPECEYKLALQEVLFIEPPQIPDFFEIYSRFKAFTFKVTLLHNLLLSLRLKPLVES